jgi:hypothetical protein
MSAVNAALLYESDKMIDLALQREDSATLYRVIPRLYSYFKDSDEFSSVADSFLSSRRSDPALNNLKRNFSLAAQKMEGYAQPAFIDALSSRNETEKIEFIKSLGYVGSNPYVPEIEFERIPELHAEMQLGGIDADSCVLILGAGSISISGLFFTCFGARVHILDRDPAAIENFLHIRPYLPEAVSRNIVIEPVCDARDYIYPAGLTHILVAGLVEPKDPVLEVLKQFYRGKNNPPRILMRMPKKNLFQLFYYATKEADLDGFDVRDIVDIGYEQSTLTYVLDFTG